MRRPWGLPLLPLYWVGVEVKNWLFGRGWLRVERLQWPVVSVGSLSAGGAGKTPVVVMLAELFARHGVTIDVLSRGYGRGAGFVAEVLADGSAREFGDEPLEMARRGVKVFVGARRVEAGRLAEAGQGQERHTGVLRSAPHDVSLSTPSVSSRGVLESGRLGHVLDDGFQHRQLHRALDVVLLTVEDVRDWLLPVGNLREKLGALRRSDVVVVREEEAAELEPVLRRFGKEDWVVRRRLALPAERPRRPMVFCGIARPEGFLRMLREAGVESVGQRVFRDHHAYGPDDFGMLVEAALHGGADGFVTTAKDAVKISAMDRKRLEEVGPVVVAELHVELVDEAKAWEILREKMKP